MEYLVEWMRVGQTHEFLPTSWTLWKEGRCVMEELEPSELGTLLRGRPGLIIGPGATLNVNSLASLLKGLGTKFGYAANHHFLKMCDGLSKTGVSDEDVRSEIGAWLAAQDAASNIDVIARANWSAVLSFSFDRHFETALHRAAVQSATREDASTIIDLDRVFVSNEVPVFKLMGTAETNTIPLSMAQYRRRRAKWPYAAEAFATRLQGRPAVVLGMTGFEEEFEDLLGSTLTRPTSHLSRLVFFASDPISRRESFASLLANNTKLLRVNSTPGKLVDAAVKNRNASDFKQLSLTFASDEEQLAKVLRSASDLFTHVPTAMTNVCEANAHNLIADRLFSPDALRWDAFVHDYDLRRDAADECLNEVESWTGGSLATAIVGNAGSGKTSVLKRIAHDLSKSNSLVLWAKPWLLDGASRALDTFFLRLSKLKGIGDHRVFVVVDDPLDYASLPTSEIVRSAMRHEVPIHLIVGARSIDWEIEKPNAFIGGLQLGSQHRIDDQLSDEEWKRLPDFLVNLRVFQNESTALSEVRKAESRAARDFFATLYFLLPEVQSSLRSSIQEQYFRLGDQAAVKKIVIGGYSESVGLLRDAWAMAAVADKYKCHLPIEVLVHGLETDFQGWLDACAEGGNAFGLLYEEKSDDETTVWFKTRNDVVTSILIEEINGTSFGHSGELQIMKRMISGCKGYSSLLYRDFIAQLITPGKKIEHFSAKDGLDLFDIAVDSLVHPDKMIEHQRAIWKSKKLDDPIGAEKDMRKALEVENFPYTERGESNRYIRTSIAANELRKMNKGLVSREDGQANVIRELSHARSLDSCDSRIAVVQGNLISNLLRTADGDFSGDLVFLLNRGLADLDRALISIRSSENSGRNFVDDQIKLEECRDGLDGFVRDLDAVMRQAEEMWETLKSQSGFVLVARLLHRNAINTGKGGAFKKTDDYCIKWFGKIEEGDCNIDGVFLEVALHNLVRWQFPMIGQSIIPVDWVRVEELAVGILSDSELASDPFIRFVYGVALAQQCRWSDAAGNFRKLRESRVPRDLVRVARCVLVDEKGVPKRVEGVVEKNGDRRYMRVEELGTDFICDARDHWRGKGASNSAFVEFSFAGPMAIGDRSAARKWAI